MDHKVIWIFPYPDKIQGITREAMRQILYSLNQDDTGLDINDKLKARFLGDSFEIYDKNIETPIFRFYFDEETFTINECHKSITDDLWVRVMIVNRGPYAYKHEYSFVIYEKIKEPLPKTIKQSKEQKPGKIKTIAEKMAKVPGYRQPHTFDVTTDNEMLTVKQIDPATNKVVDTAKLFVADKKVLEAAAEIIHFPLEEYDYTKPGPNSKLKDVLEHAVRHGVRTTRPIVVKKKVVKKK